MGQFASIGAQTNHSSSWPCHLLIVIYPGSFRMTTWLLSPKSPGKAVSCSILVHSLRHPKPRTGATPPPKRLGFRKASQPTDQSTHTSSIPARGSGARSQSQLFLEGGRVRPAPQLRPVTHSWACPFFCHPHSHGQCSATAGINRTSSHGLI